MILVVKTPFMFSRLEEYSEFNSRQRSKTPFSFKTRIIISKIRAATVASLVHVLKRDKELSEVNLRQRLQNSPYSHEIVESS